MALPSGGVPDGNPPLGAGWNIPPPMRPAPVMASSLGAHLLPGPAVIARRTATLAAMSSSPVTAQTRRARVLAAAGVIRSVAVRGLAGAAPALVCPVMTVMLLLLRWLL